MNAKQMGRFTVTGAYPFPFDMLRYDECFPESSSDAAIMERCAHPQTQDDMKRVVICLNSSRRPTAARWESFLWKVTHIDDVEITKAA